MADSSAPFIFQALSQAVFSYIYIFHQYNFIIQLQPVQEEQCSSTGI